MNQILNPENHREVQIARQEIDVSEISSSDVVFFLGAGSSAPFGIPTMKQFVVDFEAYLTENAEKAERELYTDIKRTLEERLHFQVDLEGVFTVIDGVINYSKERLGLLSLYSAEGFKRDFPSENTQNLCRSLKQKFQSFVREKCTIPANSLAKIKTVYRDLFNRFALELGGGHTSGRECAWNTDWKIFTTNYDTCLEYYWREVAQAEIDTGFKYDKVRKADFLSSEKFMQENIGAIQLFKLHGSISWLIEKGTQNVVEVMERGHSYIGREWEREMMLYPIAEKELYLDPYISMLWRLNRELERKAVWLVIGYSFNDPVVREIFIRKSSTKKRLILVHPKATEVYHQRLSGIKGERDLLDKRFGLVEEDLRRGEQAKEEEEYNKVNHQIIHKLKANPRFAWHDRPVP